ncbi:quinoprotein dehydrogenase-associated SoxYZ-like carrier [Fulvimarina sp. MAC3]|uniref:quinoprotein dehydrogenase-associated SoxYZ-like carrier n=1 Tax=Fulvimarina sp. MAC3 TaxID=3148887 RepID=UPI0031FD603D
MIRTSRTIAVAALALLSATPALASDDARTLDAWSEIRADIYGDRQIMADSPLIELVTPYRAENDLRVPIRANVDLPEGEEIKKLTLILDENPMPVSADFEMATDSDDFSVEVAMRLNGPTKVRAIVETKAGELLMKEAMVKTSGTGACAAPPTTGVEAALATLGEMDLSAPTTLERASGDHDEVALHISHPQHSGMQMDQVTLHYILARYVESVESWADDEKLFTMTGSISLSENPEIKFSIPEKDASRLRVRMTDTEGAVFQKAFSLGGS